MDGDRESPNFLDRYRLARGNAGQLNHHTVMHVG